MNKEIIKLRMAGENPLAIANKLNVSYETVITVLLDAAAEGDVMPCYQKYLSRCNAARTGVEL